MAHFGDTIRRLREDRFHWTQGELGAKIGTDAPHISRIEQKPSATVNQSTYRKLAAAFDMTPEELDREWRPGRVQQTVGAGLQLIPVINRAPAGKAVDYVEMGVDSGQGHFYIDRGGVRDPNAFAVVVVGDSMDPELAEGDYAIFSPMRTDGTLLNMPKIRVEEGHTVFVRFAQNSTHDGCTIAEIYRLGDGRIELRKRNKKYKPILVTADEISQLGALIQRRQNIIPGAVPEFEAYDPNSRNSEGDV